MSIYLVQVATGSYRVGGPVEALWPIALLLPALAAWQREGKLQFKEDVIEGIERMPEAFLRLLQGKNFGKQIVKLG